MLSFQPANVANLGCGLCHFIPQCTLHVFNRQSVEVFTSGTWVQRISLSYSDTAEAVGYPTRASASQGHRSPTGPVLFHPD